MPAPVSFGRYTIRRELGRGAMGVVYEAHDPGRGIDLALKIMSVPAKGSPDAKRRQTERFLREARALSALSHPGVVRFYDQGEVTGRHFFSMELVRGTTLRDRIQFSGALSVPELVRLAAEICDALDHVHSHGVVHRDVKPENIMLMPDGTARLMDFGIAQLASDQSSAPPGGWQGSPAYMSPEQVDGGFVDGRSDIYSLAVTLYEAATARRAVEGDSIAVITQRIRQEYPPPPGGLPPHLQAILMKALAKNPVYRYRSAAEMAADIRLGRVPTLAASAPWTAQASFPSPPPVYLGQSDQLPAAAAKSPSNVTLLPGQGAAAAAPSPNAAIPWDPSFILDMSAPPESAAAPTGMALPAAPSVTCDTHPGVPAPVKCSSCGRTVCYACHVELPVRGLLCRRCAFGR